MLKNLVKNLKPSSTLAINETSRKLEEQGKKIFKFGFGQSPFKVPQDVVEELKNTLHYETKNDGMHFWVKYTGDKPLGNKTSGLGIDLRTHKGYVVWYLEEDPRICIGDVRDSSKKLNKWLEKLFSYV